MNIRDLLKEDSIILNEHSQTKLESIEKLVARHYQCGHIHDTEKYLKAILAREELSSTGVGQMIAIPHAQDESVNYPSLVAMVDKKGVDFKSLDGLPAKLFFMIAVPKDGGTQHLEILAQLSQILMDDQVIKNLLNSKTPQQFIQILAGEMEQEKIVEENDHYDVLAVTACPTGIAHTYMAAKSLEDAAKKMGIKIKVETNGASGIKNKLTKEEIDHARCVIIAADKKVEMERFSNILKIQVPVAKGIHEAELLINEAMKKEINHELKNNVNEEKVFNEKNNPIRIFYKHLMNGVSKVIPLLMITGILTFILNNYQYQSTSTIMNSIRFVDVIDNIRYSSFYLVSLLMGAFIADSISEHLGFVVANVSSILFLMLYYDPIVSIILSVIAGYVVLGLKKICSYIPEVISSIVPNLIIPVVGTVIVVFIGKYIPFQYITNLTNGISTLSLSPFISGLIGAILGVMMAIDMGGPVNKTAYLIGILSIIYGRFDIMSAVMIGGMVAPISIGLAMLLSNDTFGEEENKGKWQCIIKGLCFVSEEAIPYMKDNKISVHLPCIIASGIAGCLSMVFGCGLSLPHGGIFVLPFIEEPLLFVIALLSASLIGTAFILMLKKTSK